MLRWTWGLGTVAAGIVVGVALAHELATSAWQARLFSEYARQVTFPVEAGSAAALALPGTGPFDLVRGYADLDQRISRVLLTGYEIERQARQSTELQRLLSHGITPPYREAPVAGLVVQAPDGSILLDAAHDAAVFERFEDIPSDIVEALLFIENRELLAPRDPRSNPAIEWDRLARAAGAFVGARLGFAGPVPGGSTLAVQLDKYRHSPDGRTGDASDKLRQMLSASLLAYREGPDTRLVRRDIVLDYMNTLPLAAAPRYGEVYGLGTGLRAWFGADPRVVFETLRQRDLTPERALALKQAVTLLAAVRAPTGYLVQDRQALERRVRGFLELMAREGKLPRNLAEAASAQPVTFVVQPPPREVRPFIERKGINALRANLMTTLGVTNVYDLNRLHLRVETTVDPPLQQAVSQLLLDLASPEFLRAHQLTGERLLRTGNPADVLYSFLLFEKTPAGNMARIQTDNLDRPLDINDGMKMELGSTAKARTLAHYLELVADLFLELTRLDPAERRERSRQATDPLTRWTAETLASRPRLTLVEILELSLERRFSASPGEAFFTGGGMHTFGNFDRDDNGRVPTLREALRKSTNLVFIRVMRELVQYHQARLPYDAAEVLRNPANPTRQQLLVEIAEAEGTRQLRRAYRRFHDVPLSELPERLLGSRSRQAREQAILFFAWRVGTTEAELAEWLRATSGPQPLETVRKLHRAFRNPDLTMSDYGYLLKRHPLEVWASDQIRHEPTVEWEEFLLRSAEVRRQTSAWLLRSRNRRAQDLRLRIRIESDAFERMTPFWQRLGFPFQRLVPSLATSLGNSSDRPVALADFMGILVNDGVRRPLRRMNSLRFAEGTPWETHLAPAREAGERVMLPEVARVLRAALAEVVDRGTARRLAGAFRRPDGTPEIVGGKTGSGDNRFKTFARGGGITSARAVNRTATFMFYVGDRYFGVVTAHVPGREAERFEFTSALPVSVLKAAAPVIQARP